MEYALEATPMNEGGVPPGTFDAMAKGPDVPQPRQLLVMALWASRQIHQLLQRDLANRSKRYVIYDLLCVSGYGEPDEEVCVG